MGEIIYALSHIGVPMFFVVSGYFFLDKENSLSWRKWIKKIKHIGILLFCHIGLYITYEMLYGFASGKSFDVILNNVAVCFKMKAFVKAVLLGTGFMGGGEWFLVSLIEAYLILGLVLQIRKLRDLF